MRKLFVVLLLLTGIASFAYNGEVVYSDKSIIVRAYCINHTLWYRYSNTYTLAGDSFAQVFNTRTGKPEFCEEEK